MPLGRGGDGGRASAYGDSGVVELTYPHLGLDHFSFQRIMAETAAKCLSNADPRRQVSAGGHDGRPALLPPRCQPATTRSAAATAQTRAAPYVARCRPPRGGACGTPISTTIVSGRTA